MAQQKNHQRLKGKLNPTARSRALEVAKMLYMLSEL